MPDFVVIQVNGTTLVAVQGPNTNHTFTAVDGSAANSAAAIQQGVSGKYASFPLLGAIQASLITQTTITNGDLQFTANYPGPNGNNIRIRYVVAGANTPLTVAVAGNDITVNVATNGASAGTSTALQIRDAVNASTPAAALVNASLAPNNDGTGVIVAAAAFAYTNLSGGANGAAVVEQVVVAPATTNNPTTL